MSKANETKSAIKRFVMRIAGLERITEEKLKSLGFVGSTDSDIGVEVLTKHGIRVWNYYNPNIGDYWLIDMLDQNGVDHEFFFLSELELFFKACGKDMYSA